MRPFLAADSRGNADTNKLNRDESAGGQDGRSRKQGRKQHCRQVVRRSASVAEVTVTTTEDLDQTLQTLEKVAVESDHSSAWVDFSLRSRSTGRGVITGGNLIPVSGDPEACQLWEPSSGPELPPLPTPGENLIHWHNRLYHLLARRASRSSFWPLEKLLFPLEAWSSWQKVYEPAGFHQHQSLIPEKAGL